MDVRCANVLLGGWFDGIAYYQVRAYSPIHLIVNGGTDASQHGRLPSTLIHPLAGRVRFRVAGDAAF
jgi:hypothetical protein